MSRDNAEKEQDQLERHNEKMASLLESIDAAKDAWSITRECTNNNNNNNNNDDMRLGSACDKKNIGTPIDSVDHEELAHRKRVEDILSQEKYLKATEWMFRPVEDYLSPKGAQFRNAAFAQEDLKRVGDRIGYPYTGIFDPPNNIGLDVNMYSTDGHSLSRLSGEHDLENLLYGLADSSRRPGAIKRDLERPASSSSASESSEDMIVGDGDA